MNIGYERRIVSHECHYDFTATVANAGLTNCGQGCAGVFPHEQIRRDGIQAFIRRGPLYGFVGSYRTFLLPLGAPFKPVVGLSGDVSRFGHDPQ
jgi:hypothetical protein